MTGQELSTLLANGHHPVVIILDNHGYGTERYLSKHKVKGKGKKEEEEEIDWKYNEVPPWNYGELLKVYGCGGSSYLVANEADFQRALKNAWDHPSEAHLIHAKLMENDASDTLKKLALAVKSAVPM